jgi:hypothetical protein
VPRAVLLLRRHSDFWLALAAGGTAAAIGYVAFKLWLLPLSVPLRIGADATLNLGWVENMLESGSPSIAPRLGFPFGLQLQDYPLGGDDLSFTLLRAFGVVSGSAIPSVTLFYLLTFPLIAIAAYWSLRSLTVSRPVAFVIAVVYAIVPFHFLRNTGHLFLSAYFGVPLACFLLAKTVSGRPLWGLGPNRPTTLRGRVGAIAAPLVAVLVIASTGSYYCAFTLLLLVPAALVGWARTRSTTVLVSALLTGALLTAVFVVELLPTISFWLANGTNADVPTRGIEETGNHQLRLMNLLVPFVGHRIGLFNSLAQRYITNFPPTGENGEYMGLVGIAGLLMLLVLIPGVLVGLFARRRIWRIERSVAVLALFAFAIAMAGGFSGAFSMIVTPQIRAWSRITTFIDFFALLAVALALSLLWRYVRPKRALWRNTVALGLVAIIPFAAYDQTASRFVVDYNQMAVNQATMVSFMHQVESALPAGAALYQLPYRTYLEGGQVAGSADYDPLIPYLYSNQLRFSYGGLKGREAGWQLWTYEQPITQALPMLCLAGFSAVWLDRQAYEEGTSEAVESELQTSLNVTPLLGVNDRFVVYDMQQYCTNQAAATDPGTLATWRDELMRPVWVRWGSGVQPISPVDVAMSRRRLRVPSKVNLFNAGDGGRNIVVSFRLDKIDPAGATFQVVWPDGTVRDVALGETVTQTLALAAGSNPLTFRETGPIPGIPIIANFWAVDSDSMPLAP